MKKILALPALLLALCSMAQKPVFRYPLETEPKTNPDVLVMTHPSGSKTAFLLKNKKKIDYLLTGSDFKLIASFTNAQTPDKTIYGTTAIPAGFIYNGQKLYNFIYDENSRGGKTNPGRDVLLMDVIDFNGKQSELAVKHTFESGEKVVNAFTYNNTYYMLSVPTGGDALSVCYIDSTLNKTVRTYQLSATSLVNGYNTLINLFKKASVVYPDRENDLEAATAAVKIMPQPGGKIVIASDQKGFPTSLAVIDLYNNRLDLIQMQMSELCLKDDKNAAVNSTVLGNYMITTVACKQKFELAVYDYNTGKLIKKHESGKDDGAPAIALGGLNAETFSDGKKKGEKSLDNTGGLLKAMWNGNCGVRVSPSTQNLVLTIGAYKSGKETVFPGIYRPEDAAPDYVAPFHYTNYGPQLKFNTDYSTAWFRTALTGDKFEKVKLNLKPGAMDKLRDVLSMEEKLPESIPVFTMGGVYYYPWYDAETQQFTVRSVK